MPAKRTAMCNQGRGKQRGAVLIIMLVILVVGIAAILVNSLTSSRVKTARQENTAAALAQAKDALIGRAIADPNHPGSLPCPDVDDDGMITITGDYNGSNCKSLIGRLPWKTLGLPDLRDGSGERLWYAVSPSFLDNTSNPINSNSKGTLLVYDNSGITLLTPPGSEAIAIVFAAGDVVASQLRDTANQNLPQNYLDVGPNGINNASAGGPFIAADTTSSFNDHLMIIRTRDLIPFVEMRVTNELSTAFASYLAANGKYPYPAKFASCTSASCPGDSITPTCIGKVPATDLTPFMPATLSTYFTPNNWFDVIYYTAGTASLPGGGVGGGGGAGKKGRGKGKGGGGGGGSGGGSTICPANNTSTLTVLNPDGTTLTSNASALFLMPDTPLGGITRTSMSSTNLPDYFEDAENQNLDNLYIMPTAISNDSLYILP